MVLKVKTNLIGVGMVPIMADMLDVAMVLNFINMTLAAKETGCQVQSIWGTCNGRQHTGGGYGWEYVNEEK